jgi:hypothetical protein
MQTDEYEISLSREIAICRKMIRRLQDSLTKREKQGHMTTAEFLEAPEKGGPSGPPAQPGWQQDYQELQYWQQLLADYELALHSLKVS